MSAHALPAEPQDEPGQRAADAQFYRQVLHDLINMGTDLARLVHQQATAQAAQQAVGPARQSTEAQQAPAPPPDPTIAFDRIARAIRRSVALARSLAQPAQPAPDPARHRADARKRILREVEDAIQRTANPDGDAAESLNAELRDRLDGPDLDGDISSRPVADIVTEICRDLGLASPPGAHPWKRRTPDDIAQLCARAAAPTRQAGAAPQGPKQGAAQCPPGFPSPNPAAVPRAQPGPVHSGSGPPTDPAAIIAAILRHPTRDHGRWRPPPGS